MGKHCPKMQCSMTNFFGAYITGVRRELGNPSQKGDSNSFKFVLFTETYLLPCKKCFPTI